MFNKTVKITDSNENSITIGRKDSANSIPVVLPSDYNFTTTPTITTTPTVTRVSSSATSVTLLALNTGRLGVVLVNDSTSTCYVKFGTTASSTSYTYLMDAKSTLVLEPNPLYTGRVDGIWASANGAMQITELTV